MVPLAGIITASQNKASYSNGFQLLQDCGRSLNDPQVSLVDDSAAEQLALHDTCSDSTQPVQHGTSTNAN